MIFPSHTGTVPQSYRGINTRDYQHCGINCAIDAARNDLKGARAGISKPKPRIMELTTGAGKNKIGCIIAAFLAEKQQRVAMLVADGALVSQIHRELCEMKPMVPNSVYCASVMKSSKSKRREPGYNVMVGSPATMINGLTRHFIGWVPDKAIVDEAHQVNWQDLLECYKAAQAECDQSITYDIRKITRPRTITNENGKQVIGPDPYTPEERRTHREAFLRKYAKLYENKVTTKHHKVKKESDGEYEYEEFEVSRGRFSTYAVVLTHFMLLNPSLLITGMTATPYRNNETIVGSLPGYFWKERVGPRVSSQYLVSRGFLTGDRYGAVETAGVDFGDEHKDKIAEQGNADFSAEFLKKFEKSATTKEGIENTHSNMVEVIRLTKDRLGVLVTCAGSRHCKIAAEPVREYYCEQLRKRIIEKGYDAAAVQDLKYGALKKLASSLGCDLSGDYAIITQNTKNREAILDRVRSGEIKFTFQIGCLTTGVDVPYWDTSVLMRPIGSLTLLTQLLGRGKRLLTPEQIAAGLVKHYHLILDYAAVLENMLGRYESQEAEEADLQKSKRENRGDTQRCECCGYESSAGSQRCMGPDPKSSDGRCENFFEKDVKKLQVCKCGTINTSRATFCRKCGTDFLDYNKIVYNKHYKAGSEIPIVDMKYGLTDSGRMWARIVYDMQNPDGSPYVANISFYPFGKQKFMKAEFKSGFADVFVPSLQNRKIMVNAAYKNDRETFKSMMQHICVPKASYVSKGKPSKRHKDGKYTVRGPVF